MQAPYFNQDLILYLAENRLPGLTEFFLAASFLGEIEGYVLIIAAILVFWNQRLALQSTAVVLTSMIVNHVLKIIIQNPRPFALEGTHLDHWAVPHANALELAAEFSTPSGHAMAAAAFYGFLWARAQNVWLKYLFVIGIIITGVSRPVLGVHFAEDIAIGWALGLVIAWLLHRHIDAIWARLSSMATASRAAIAATISISVWVITIMALDRPLPELPTAFVNYIGFLSGVILIAPSFADDKPQNLPLLGGLLRWVLFVGIIIAIIVGADYLFAMLADEQSITGFALRYLRYLLVAVLGFWFAKTYAAPNQASR